MLERTGETPAPRYNEVENCPALLHSVGMTKSVFTGPVYVVRDNIDTDQIIPAQYLNLVPTIPEEYEKLGAYALCGLPESLYATRYVKDEPAVEHAEPSGAPAPERVAPEMPDVAPRRDAT